MGKTAIRRIGCGDGVCDPIAECVRYIFIECRWKEGMARIHSECMDEQGIEPVVYQYSMRAEDEPQSQEHMEAMTDLYLNNAAFRTQVQGLHQEIESSWSLWCVLL